MTQRPRKFYNLLQGLGWKSGTNSLFEDWHSTARSWNAQSKEMKQDLELSGNVSKQRQKKIT